MLSWLKALRTFTTTRAALPAVVVLALFAACGVARGQITLSQDFACGSLRVNDSVVSGNNVTIAPRLWEGYYHWWFAFEASGVSGKTPQFALSVSNYQSFQRANSATRYVYSYDQVHWQFFDKGSVSTGYSTFSNNAPFTQNNVYIAYGLPYTPAMTAAHTTGLAASPYVSATASGNGQFVIGHSAGGTDDTGRTFAPQNLYGYKITDLAAGGAKAKVVLMAGNHSGESTGNYTLQGLVDFLVSADPRAAWMRQHAEFYVYPMVDPDGRQAGYFRSNMENPDPDHNRSWNDPAGFTDVTAVENAMKADTGGHADYFFDFHSSGWSNFNGVVYNALGNPKYDQFNQALTALQPTLDYFQTNFTAAGAASSWAHTANGLGAGFSMTPEAGYLTGWQPSDYFDMGKDYGLALYTVMPEPGCMAMLGLGWLVLLRRRVGRRAGAENTNSTN